MKAIFLCFVLLVGTSALKAETQLIYQGAGEADASATQAANMGTELAEKGDYAGARRYYDAAIRRAPNDWLTYYSRAQVFIHERQWQLAIQDLNSCTRLKRSFFLAFLVRGIINSHLGNYKSSLAEYNAILNLHPMEGAKALALSSRAWLRATCPNASFRNGQEAVSDAKAACNLSSWRKPDYIDTLAAAHAEAGDFDAAVKFEEKAIAHYHDADAIKGAQQRLALYREHRPYRDG